MYVCVYMCTLSSRNDLGRVVGGLSASVGDDSMQLPWEWNHLCFRPKRLIVPRVIGEYSSQQ